MQHVLLISIKGISISSKGIFIMYKMHVRKYTFLYACNFNYFFRINSQK